LAKAQVCRTQEDTPSRVFSICLIVPELPIA
jgi:hypothetical protein